MKKIAVSFVLAMASGCVQNQQAIECTDNTSGEGGGGGGKTQVQIPSCDMPVAFESFPACYIPTCCERTVFDLNAYCTAMSGSTAIACDTDPPPQDTDGMTCVKTELAIACIGDGITRIVECCHPADSM